jgi:hypothetical protein
LQIVCHTRVQLPRTAGKNVHAVGSGHVGRQVSKADPSPPSPGDRGRVRDDKQVLVMFTSVQTRSRNAHFTNNYGRATLVLRPALFRRVANPFAFLLLTNGHGLDDTTAVRQRRVTGFAF